MSLNQILNYFPIFDNLATAGQPQREQFLDISRAGYTVVINLALTTSDNAIPDEAIVVNNLGMEYIHIPVVWEAPQPGDFERFCTELERLRRQKVFVHCALNMRVSAFVYLYRVLYLGANPDEVKWDMLSIWEPEGVWKDFIAVQLNERPAPGRNQR
jgi:protein tyrosine phosphatase (PTP) superfamily phosphohydrolase (DUF442 family)